ncbi:hypothetical protein B5X24_HaOG208228 [Helicoverpa armigera]|uniref:Uncharacterized protein n=1 Tax=Helicoverpa armigera TaxID=29058 RepID=A0A2W1BMQ6_HELAM|nr:hypothetical protein B5X24_HaOG208228 [Helicoverpa armigera]
MQLQHIAVLLSITLTPALSVRLTANSLNSLFQGIMSPQSTEQTLQALTLGTNKRVEPAVTRRFAIIKKVPKEPRKIIALVTNPKEIGLKNVQQNSNNVIVQKKPKTVLIQRKMDTVTPKTVIGETQILRNLLLKNDAVAKRVIVQKRVPQVKKEVQQKVLIAQPKGTEYVKVPQKKVGVQNGNPYLPAASPVSPLTASLSSASKMPQSRGQFLKKIPIPPPTM